MVYFSNHRFLSHSIPSDSMLVIFEKIEFDFFERKKKKNPIEK